jgi:hypothetical protein
MALPAWLHSTVKPLTPGVHRLLLGAAVVLLVVVATVLLAKWGSRGEAQLEQLAEPARRALYYRTLADLELCATSAGRALGDHCTRQAEFIQGFPECDAACQSLVRSWVRIPTR